MMLQTGVTIINIYVQIKGESELTSINGCVDVALQKLLNSQNSVMIYFNGQKMPQN